MNLEKKNQMMSNLIKANLNNLKRNNSLDLKNKEYTPEFYSEEVLALNIDLRSP